jgi:hypothetical protein
MNTSEIVLKNNPITLGKMKPPESSTVSKITKLHQNFVLCYKTIFRIFDTYPRIFVLKLY